jgi:hypothetical protein
MQVTKQLALASGHPILFFGCCDRDQVVENDWLQSLHCGGNVTPPCRPWGCVILLCETWQKWPWRLTYMTWLCHLNAAFWKQCMETQENFLRFWYRKCIKWVKKLFCHQICYFVGRKFNMRGCIKRATCNVDKMGLFWCFLILTS